MPSATTKIAIVGTKRKAEATKEKHQKKPKISKPAVEEKPIKEKKSKKPIVKTPIESDSSDELDDKIDSSEDESDGGVVLADEEAEDVDMDKDEETGPSAKNGLHPDRVKKVEANSTDTFTCSDSMMLIYT